VMSGGSPVCECSGFWKGIVCDNCTLPCIHGNIDSSCSKCTCQGNWEGPDCSRK
jgi:hypothetical protein